MEDAGAYQSCDATGTIKILMIGNSSVGKSCLLARYSEGDYSEEHNTTIGMDFKLRQLDVDGRIMKLQIWDTAGQERFRTITRAYYRGASAVVIVYDVTDEKSFRDVHSWYEMAKENASQDVVMVLCANKVDMAEGSPRNSQLADVDVNVGEVNVKARVGEDDAGKEIEPLPRRVVSSARGQALAQEYDIAYLKRRQRKTSTSMSCSSKYRKSASSRRVARRSETETNNS